MILGTIKTKWHSDGRPKVILMSRLEVHKSRSRGKKEEEMPNPPCPKHAKENGGNLCVLRSWGEGVWGLETIGEVVFTIQRESTATKNKSYVCTKNHVQSFPVQLLVEGPMGSCHKKGGFRGPTTPHYPPLPIPNPQAKRLSFGGLLWS